MDRSRIPLSEIMQLLHENSENAFAHTTYREESRRFHLLMQGDMRAVEESERMCAPELQGTLSSDPLRNARYLFIVNTGLATRYAIEAGLPQEQVYAASDVFIQKADVTDSIETIRELNRQFWTLLVEMVQRKRAEKRYTKPVMACIDFIDAHVAERITLQDLAKETDMHPAYISVLFKKETGETFGEYLLRRRIDIARALLLRTEYPYSKIAYSLSFCSQSYFSKVFRERTGYTPHQYRMRFYNSNISRGDGVVQ